MHLFVPGILHHANINIQFYMNVFLPWRDSLRANCVFDCVVSLLDTILIVYSIEFFLLPL